MIVIKFWHVRSYCSRSQFWIDWSVFPLRCRWLLLSCLLKICRSREPALLMGLGAAHNLFEILTKDILATTKSTKRGNEIVSMSTWLTFETVIKMYWPVCRCSQIIPLGYLAATLRAWRPVSKRHIQNWNWVVLSLDLNLFETKSLEKNQKN